MKKGIGPNNLGAPKSPAKILGAIAGAVAPALIKGAAGALAGKLMGGKSPAKQIGVDKKETKAFEKNKRQEARAERKLERLDAKKQKVVDKANKKMTRSAKRILGDKYGS